MLQHVSGAAEQPQCVWYGQCHKDSLGRIQDCLYRGPPKPLTNSTGTDLLKKWCPHFFDNIREYSYGAVNFEIFISRIFQFSKKARLEWTQTYRNVILSCEVLKKIQNNVYDNILIRYVMTCLI